MPLPMAIQTEWSRKWTHTLRHTPYTLLDGAGLEVCCRRALFSWPTDTWVCNWRVWGVEGPWESGGFSPSTEPDKPNKHSLERVIERDRGLQLEEIKCVRQGQLRDMHREGWRRYREWWKCSLQNIITFRSKF